MRCCLAAAARLSLALIGLGALAPFGFAQDLAIKSSHTGTFLLGQTNAYYLLRVSNVGSVPTAGTVTVTENPPAALAITKMYGQGWTCTATSCTRGDALAGGAAYPAIMVIGSVAQTAGSNLTNVATVGGGGDINAANNTTNDPTAVAAHGYPLAWGADYDGQADTPPGLADVVAIAAGGDFTVALRADGTVVAWGANNYSQTVMPQGLSDVIAIAAGQLFSLALKSNGTVIAWGTGRGQTDLPTGLANVVAISAGQAFGVALEADGKLVAWGDNTYGQTAVPTGASDVVAIATGWYHGLALKRDGTVESWGYTPNRSWVAPPAGLANVVAISAYSWDCEALRSDGTVAVWGYDSIGSTNLPVGLSNVISIATGESHSLALKSDGTLVAWGSTVSYSGEQAVPSGLSGIISIAAGNCISYVILSAAPKTIPVTIASIGGLGGLTVDGRWSDNTPFVQDWIPGSSHALGALSPVAAGPGTQLIFTGWSDGGATDHTVTPTLATTYTAHFKAQRQLTTVAGTGGTISPASGWVDDGTTVQITATPNIGYVFAGFTGGLTGLSPSQRLTVTAPATVTANFVPTSLCAYALNPSAQSFPASGGTGAITVATLTGCAWSVTNALSWVTLTGAASGTSSSTLGFQIAANSGVTRTGTFTVAGQTFTVEQEGNTQFTTTALFPHFAAGAGWNTRLILINTGVSPVTVRLNFFADQGTPITLPLNLPQTFGTAPMVASTLERTIAAGATLVVDTTLTGVPTTETGWAQVLSTAPLAGYENFRESTAIGTHEVFLPLQTGDASKLILPFDHTAGYGTGIAIANTSTLSNRVGITLRDDQGNFLMATTTLVPAQGHAAFDLAGQYSITTGIRGTIEIDTASFGHVGGLGVRYGAAGEIAAVAPVVQ